MNQITEVELDEKLPSVLKDIVLEYLKTWINIFMNDKISCIRYESSKYFEQGSIHEEIKIPRRISNIVTLRLSSVMIYNFEKDRSLIYDSKETDTIFFERNVPQEILSRYKNITHSGFQTISLSGELISKELILEWIDKGIVNSIFYDIEVMFDISSIEETVRIMRSRDIDGSLNVNPVICYPHQNLNYKDLLRRRLIREKFYFLCKNGNFSLGLSPF